MSRQAVNKLSDRLREAVELRAVSDIEQIIAQINSIPTLTSKEAIVSKVALLLPVAAS